MIVRKKYRYKTSDTKEKKLFVGNVPYNCTQKDFYNCFINVDGFINAELIVNNNTGISRGFGFITIDTDTNATKLKNKIIVFKERELRFTNYQNTKYMYNYDSKNNYLYISNIPDGKNREWLKKCFNKYEPIGKYLILTNHQTGVYKNCGVVEITNDELYKTLLSKKNIYYDNIKLNISKYKIQIYNNNNMY